MRSAFRLAWLQQRSELRILLGACVAVLIIGLVLAWQMRAVRTEELACYQSANDVGRSLDACHEVSRQVAALESGIQIVHGVVAVAPFLLGLFIGAPIVAREIEGRTGSIVWSLSRSRWRWLVGRSLPLLACLVAGAAILAVVGELLTHVLPWVEGAETGFADYAMRGPLIVVRAVAAFVIAVLIGAVLGRQLPAVIVAGMLCIGVVAWLSLDMDAELARQAVPLDPQEMQQGPYPKVYGSALRVDASGELITYEAYYVAHPELAQARDIGPGVTPMSYAVPGDWYWSFVARESMLLGATSIIAAAAAAAVIRRRRPY